MPNVLPTIPQEPAQGIQALLDTVYLWNPDVANNLIEQVNELLEELGELSNLSGAIKPYSQLEAPVRQYMPMSYNDGVYVANEEMTTLPATPDLTKWTLIATKVDEQALEQQISSAVGGEADLRRQADNALQGNIDAEERARIAADQGLQTQIDAISAASDVKDIVGTYQELENYDTSTLGDNDIIKVLQDETQEDATTYYRWVAAEDEFQLIGEEGPYYTKAQTDAMLEEKQDIMQFSTMPEADASNVNKVIQYVGEDVPESPASAVVTQTVGSSLTNLSVNVDTFVEAEQPSGSETVNFVATAGNKEIVGATTGHLGPNMDVELTITNPSAFVEKAKNAWDAQYGEQLGYFEDVVDGFLITAFGDTNLGINVIREIDCRIDGSSYAVAPVFPDASEWYLQVASTPMLDGEWGAGFDLGTSVIWSKNGTTADLTDYGVTYSGTPADGDTISVAYTPAVKPLTGGYFYVNTPAYSEPAATIEQTVGTDSISFETTSGDTTISGDIQAFNNLLADIGWTPSDVPSTGTLLFTWHESDDAWFLELPLSGWGDYYVQTFLEQMGFVFTGTPADGDAITANYHFGLSDLSINTNTFITTEQPTGDETINLVASNEIVFNELSIDAATMQAGVPVTATITNQELFFEKARATFGDEVVENGNVVIFGYFPNAAWNIAVCIDGDEHRENAQNPAEWGVEIVADGEISGGDGVWFYFDLEHVTSWKRNGTTVDIYEYGVTYSGEPSDGDTITVNYTAPHITGYAWEQINVQPGGADGVKWAGQWDKPASTTWNYYYPHYIFPTLPDGNYEFVVQSKSLYQYSSGVQTWSHKTFKITFGVANHRSRGIVAWVLDGNTDFYNYNMSSTPTFTHWSSYYESNPLDRIVADHIGACRIGNAAIRASAVEGVFRWTNIKNTDTGEEIPVEIDVLLNPTGSGNQIGSYNAGNPVDPPYIPQALSYTTGDCNDSTQYIIFGDTLLPQVHTVALCGSFKIVLKDADGSEWRCVVENNANSFVARVLKASGIFVNTQLGWTEGVNIGGTCVFLNTPAGTEKTIEMWISLYGSTISARCWLTQSVSNFTPVLVTRPGSLVTTDNFGLIEQYTGETDANYTNGYFYKATGTKVSVPESIAITTVTPVGEATVTIDLANWIDAVAATYGWGAETIRLWLADYSGVTWNLSYDADNAEVTRLYIPWYGDTYEPNILQYVTVAYTGSQEGEVWVQFQEQYTKAHEEIQNGHWEQIDVQPAPSGLPDQTGQSGKFLTTDGTDASWSDKAVVNNATGNYSIAMGYDSVCEANNSVAVGGRTRSVGSYNVAIGSMAENSSSSGQAGQMQIAIGYYAKTRAYCAIQLGMGQNRDANTFKVGNDNGNFEIMSADGTIPADRLVHAINWYSTMPTASADNLDDIIQFTGATDANYTNGYFYKCVVASTTPASATIAQTTGNTLSDLTVDGETFWEKLGDYSIPQQTGDYAFTYDEGVEGWKFDNNYFDLEAEFGVTYTGTPADGDVLTISVTAPSATYAWEQVDVQPNTGTLTPDFNSVKFNGLSTLQSRDYYMDVSGQYYLRIGAGASLSGDDLLIRTGSSAQRSIAFGSGDGGAIGSASSKFGRVYTQKINNGADITVPNVAGEMVVANFTGASQGDVLTLDASGNAVWQAGGGGSSYTAGVGIDITNDEISLETNDLVDESERILVGHLDLDTGEPLTGWTSDYVRTINGDTGDVQLFPESVSSVPQYPYLAYDEMFDPQAPRNHGLVVQYSGTTDQDYTQGYFYKSVIDTSVPEGAALGTVTEVGISNVALDASTFITAMGSSDYDQSYTFDWNDTDGEWYLDWSGENVGSDLTSYGITYDGTPTEGDSITVEYTAQGYKWERIDVQPSGSGGLQNTATGTESLTVLGTATTENYAVNIGVLSQANGQQATAVGRNAIANRNSIAIGCDSQAGSYSVAIGGVALGSSFGDPRIAIGRNAVSGAAYAIQIGADQVSGSTNSDSKTVKIYNGNGNFEIMSADGTVPHGRLTNAVVSNTVTIAVADWGGGTTCTKTISGLTATSVVWVAPDNASQSDYLTAGVYASAQTTDTITFTATTTPTSALTVYVIYC